MAPCDAIPHAPQRTYTAFTKAQPDHAPYRARFVLKPLYVVAANYAAESSVAGFPGFPRSVAITETGASLSGSGTGYKAVVVTVAARETAVAPTEASTPEAAVVGQAVVTEARQEVLA